MHRGARLRWHPRDPPGVSSAFIVVTGHDESVYTPILENLAPKCATVVFLMGLGNRARLADMLLMGGWPAETGAAIVMGAQTPGEWIWKGQLDQLGDAPVPTDRKGNTAATLVVGDVVGVSAQLTTLGRG